MSVALWRGLHVCIASGSRRARELIFNDVGDGFQAGLDVGVQILLEFSDAQGESHNLSRAAQRLMSIK